MLQHIKKRKDEHGFTIIEVLIVLAIAALILVVVLIAIPNLQRSQRNSARKSEASRILTAANTVVSNNNGTALTGASGTDQAAILAESGGNLKQLIASNGNQLTAGTGPSLTMSPDTLNVGVATASGTVTYGTADKDAVLVVQNAACGTASSGSVTYTYAPRQIALFYSNETSGTPNRTPLCIGS